jgi:hypothetical protein
MASNEGLAWLEQVCPDEVVECKAQGHGWPLLRIRQLNGVRAEPVGRGVFNLVSACPNCLRERYKVTKRGGVLDPAAIYLYRGGMDGYSPPKDADLTRADYVQELSRRMQENRVITNGSEGE